MFVWLDSTICRSKLIPCQGIGFFPHGFNSTFASSPKTLLIIVSVSIRSYVLVSTALYAYAFATQLLRPACSPCLNTPPFPWPTSPPPFLVPFTFTTHLLFARIESHYVQAPFLVSSKSPTPVQWSGLIQNSSKVSALVTQHRLD